MSAQLNTVAGTIYEDFIGKITTASVSESTASVIMKCTVVLVGTICVGLVFVVEKLKGIVQVRIVMPAPERCSQITGRRIIKRGVLLFSIQHSCHSV